ncbi:nucleophosmin 1b [Hoplias malabaricus]|uniref:nucleophosmin 1b n=1 Tax=Hoplias malabaricus TaxID=27720 RepID=UPI0034634F48
MAEDSIPDLSRPQMFLFGCVLKSDKKEYKVELDDDEADHQLSLKSVCLGAEAEDKFHTVEIEGVTYDGKTTKIPLAVLKPSILPSLSLGGFEVTPPVSFRLQSGAGPVYISGQHFVSVKESDDEEEEEENNTSPVKRPSSMAPGKVPQKKLKMESDEDDDDDDDDDDSEDDDTDDDDEDDKAASKKPLKSTKKDPVKNKDAGKQNGSPGKKDNKPGKPQSQAPEKGKDKTGAGPSGKSPSIPSISEVKDRLATAAKEGKPFPKTEQKFENYAKFSFKISDKQVIKDLWNFVQTLKK